jgi:hypothetical protein
MTYFKSIGENEMGCDTTYSRFKRIEKGFVFANINDVNLNNSSSFTDINGMVYPLELIKRVGISSDRVVSLELFTLNEKPLYPQVDAKNSSIILAYINSLLCNQ